VGLTTPQAEELLRQHGYNEVKAKQTPEWKKIAWRYLDWVCLIIVSAWALLWPAEPSGHVTGHACCLPPVQQHLATLCCCTPAAHHCSCGRAVQALQHFTSRLCPCQQTLLGP
jgi:hypothetical protein